MSRGRVIEFELDLMRLLLAAGLLVVVLGGAFWLGRSTAPDGGSGMRVASPAGATTAEDGSFAPGTGSIFDSAGGDGARRSLGRQVTNEVSLGGRFEVDLGTVAGRRAAEALRSRVEAEGYPALVVGAGEGRYRVTGGPFATEVEATRASRALSELLGRETPVSGP